MTSTVEEAQKVHRRRTVRTWLHASESTGCCGLCSIQGQDALRMITLLEKAKDGIQGKTGTKIHI